MQLLPCASPSRSKMYKRMCVAAVLLGTLAAGVYFVYFHRPPTDDILAANARNRKSLGLGGKMAGQRHLARLSNKGGADEDYEYYDDDLDEAALSRLRWDEFIQENNYIAIGSLFNKCEGDDSIMIGCVVLLQDTRTGGLTSKTFVNATLDKDIEEGEMYLDCWYNGKALYSNHWDVCHVEDDMEDRIINCPVTRGKKKFIKNMKIPNYLPKGHYETKAWLLDTDDKEIGCAFADFTI